MEVKIDTSWKNILQDEFSKQYFIDLTNKVKEEYKNKIIYPKGNEIFNAFQYCTFENTKVVILGQDPYHGINEANGLAFSVNKGIRVPPSLKNIYKEIENDLNIKVNKEDGDLSRWAKQGVLLLNSTLTVRKDSAGSHQGIGWEIFTDYVIQRISDLKSNIVFILWGKYAKEKGKNINNEKHLIISSPHPSPFAADRGFFGSKPFSKTNQYLLKHDIKPIDWS